MAVVKQDIQEKLNLALSGTEDGETLIVALRWLDSFSALENPWEDPYDVPDENDIYSVGWLVRQTDKNIYIASGISEHTHKTMNVTVIPKCAITGITIIEGDD